MAGSARAPVMALPQLSLNRKGHSLRKSVGAKGRGPSRAGDRGAFPASRPRYPRPSALPLVQVRVIPLPGRGPSPCYPGLADGQGRGGWVDFFGEASVAEATRPLQPETFIAPSRRPRLRDSLHLSHLGVGKAALQRAWRWGRSPAFHVHRPPEGCQLVCPFNPAIWKMLHAPPTCCSRGFARQWTNPSSGSSASNAWKSIGNLERAMGFEPTTPTLARLCSTPELRPHRPRRVGTRLSSS